MFMKRIRKTTAAAVAGLGALALLASPTFAGGDHGGTDQVQLAHMGQGQGGGWAGRAGHMGTMGRGHGMGPGYGMGPGMMMDPGTMMGHGMMMGPGYGMGHGTMMGPAYGVGTCPGFAARADKDLDADDVRSSIERSLDWHGNKRLKVGDVNETDDDTIVAEIVTLDGSLVQRLAVDRHSGGMQQVD